MPLAGTADQPIDHPYFISLKELDEYWVQPRKKLSGILPYVPRSVSPGHQNKGKLLVCHDYKGGYKEKPRGLSYSFNFWFSCDIFIYFSHHRVTIPPPGWVNASHRQGVKMLGTIIFESGGEEDCLRLLVGELPKTHYGPAKPSPSTASLPISPHYAKVLAELAYQRGFDGYLLNFECPLAGSFEQTRALSAWITILRSELYSIVGSHAEVIWYDSVVVTGQLAWQDRLNSYNLPFFLSSDSFFSNYTWRSHYPNDTAQYFLSLDPTVIQDTVRPSSSPTDNAITPHKKTISDIYMGVDVWGRGSHGGGGFGCYRAVSHISPDSLGLSVALFGQAWSWETIEGKPEFTWETWWKRDATLWTGPVSGRGEDVEVPEAPKRNGEPDCEHGAFKSISSFFDKQQPPDPCELPLHTTFSPGVGHAWFVNGVKVHDHGVEGWTDIDKQGSLGDMVWPRPTLAWEVEQRDEPLPHAISAIDFIDVWNGGSSLKLTVSITGSDDENAAFRCIWVPIQSVIVRQGDSYEARVVYKTGVSVVGDGSPDIDVNFSINTLVGGQSPPPFEVDSKASTDTLPGGWSELIVQYKLTDADDGGSAQNQTAGALGFILAIASEDPSQSFDLIINVGQLNVYPTLIDTQPQVTPGLMWANVVPSTHQVTQPTDVNPGDSQPITAVGKLTWGGGVSLPPLGFINIRAVSPEDPNPLWVLPSNGRNTSGEWLPRYIYFNIYVLPFRAPEQPGGQEYVGQPEEATWIGTTGIDGQATSFLITKEHLAAVDVAVVGTSGSKKLRFFVQGVDHHGRVMDWDRCVFADNVLG